MCYSAMVKQEAKELGLEFKARVQLDLYEDLFARRAKGEKLLLNKAMENQFLLNPDDAGENRIAELIKKWRNDQIALLESKLNDATMSEIKINQARAKIKKLATNDYVSEDERSVFPFSYVSAVIGGKSGERVVVPLRYHMRPHGKPESFDRKFGGCYNARRDNLENSVWGPVFGKRHGIVIAYKFYEHVPTEKYQEKFELSDELRTRKSVIVSFQPKHMEYMIIPALWDVNKQTGKPDLYSLAIITDDPPQEIAETGHERCPIFLKRENVEQWLNPKNLSIDELYKILRDRVRPHYSHSLVTAA